MNKIVPSHQCLTYNDIVTPVNGRLLGKMLWEARYDEFKTKKLEIGDKK